MKRICFGADFSEGSRPALRTAIELAKKFEAELVLLHVFSPPGYTFPDGSFVPASAKELLRATEAVDQSLEVWRAEVAKAGARATAKSVMGHPSTELLRFAKEAPCDMIVMGTHGRGALQHAFMGSVAERVVRGATCPVLTVRQGAPNVP
jgi:nucleotide-binding universal stress UspA family protein